MKSADTGRRYGHSSIAALSLGIRVHTVAASGLDGYDKLGTVVWRQVAQLTRGKFVFVEYGSTASSMKSHQVKGQAESNNLDTILLTLIQVRLTLTKRWQRGPARLGPHCCSG